MLTVTHLQAAGIAPAQAETFLAPLSAACARFGISTADRLAAFIAQCAVESGRFTALEENLNYSTPERIRAVFPARVQTQADAQALVRNPQGLANRVYAGRNGNGDALSGDGWRFRGRGLIQLTGKANYAEAATGLALPLVTNPDLAAQPEGACMTAAWYWHARKLNLLADAQQWDSITRQVNGPAMLHAAERKAITLTLREALAA
jgi:putative chitinase